MIDYAQVNIGTKMGHSSKQINGSGPRSDVPALSSEMLERIQAYGSVEAVAAGSGMRQPSGSRVVCDMSDPEVMGFSGIFRIIPVGISILPRIFYALSVQALTFTGSYHNIPHIVRLRAELQDVAVRMRIHSCAGKQKAKIYVNTKCMEGLL